MQDPDEPNTGSASAPSSAEPLRNERSGGATSVATLAGIVVSALAELPDRALLDERALSSALHVTKRTIRRMVARYELPPPVPFAGRSMWQVRRLHEWFDARAERLARDAQRAARKLHASDNGVS